VRAAVKGRADLDFAAICEENLDAVFGYLLYLTGNRTVAEDLAGETFERALRRLKRFDPRRGTARTWLLTLARSTALDHFRSEERRRRREGTYAFLEQGVVESDVFGHGYSSALEGALHSLSPGEREVVALRVLLDLDGETAARLLGISPTACSTRLHRALQKLEEKVRDDVRA
jgi:RNA polymerase sigma-70 factor (ECF subfamily)